MKQVVLKNKNNEKVLPNFITDDLSSDSHVQVPSVYGINKALERTVLFEGWTTENITLNDDISNYSVIEFQFMGNNGSVAYTKLLTTNSSGRVNLFTANFYDNIVYIQVEMITVKGNTITRGEQKEIYVSTTNQIADTGIYISKVIGYK